MTQILCIIGACTTEKGNSSKCSQMNQSERIYESCYDAACGNKNNRTLKRTEHNGGACQEKTQHHWEPSVWKVGPTVQSPHKHTTHTLQKLCVHLQRSNCSAWSNILPVHYTRGIQNTGKYLQFGNWKRFLFDSAPMHSSCNMLIAFLLPLLTSVADPESRGSDCPLPFNTLKKITLMTVIIILHLVKSTGNDWLANCLSFDTCLGPPLLNIIMTRVIFVV